MVSGQSGLITKPSKYSFRETIDRFEDSIKAKGWIVFAELDHAAAANQAGLALHERTVVVFGYPTAGTPMMQQAPTLAIDAPLKALVWQDDHGKVWLTYNSGEYWGNYIYPHHGLTMSTEALRDLEWFLDDISDQCTK